jgi:AmmeMemoRadiSam system protein B
MKIITEVTGMVLLFTSLLYSQPSEQVRSAEVAGMFYPGNPQELTHMIDGYLAGAELVVEGDIGGLVSPHAGYVYSGPVAAWSYKQVSGKKYDVVVVIAPSHFEYFSGISIYPGKYYETPLGKIRVDRELTEALVQYEFNIQFSEAGHEPGSGGRGEHSLEVQLPFLQKTVGSFKLVPIVIANQSWENIRILGEALASVLNDKKALIVASSDLSHYHSYQTAYQLDQSLIDYFNEFEYKELLEKCEKRQIEACGYGPIAAMMYACEKLGFTKSKVLKYATSGDVPVGEKSQVVGYLSGVVYK